MGQTSRRARDLCFVGRRGVGGWIGGESDLEGGHVHDDCVGGDWGGGSDGAGEEEGEEADKEGAGGRVLGGGEKGRF